ETNTVLNTSNEYEDINRTEDNIQQYIKKSKIQNTDACTQKWNGKPYKIESIVSAYTSLRRFLYKTSVIKNVNINDQFQFSILYQVVNRKCMKLQDQEYGETDKSKELTKEEIRQILLYLNSGDQTAIYFDFQSDGSLIFTIGHEKNNQGGLQGQNKYGKFSSQHIHIPADLPNNEFKPIQNL
ncbi:7435_t:CDS:2, partial [Cetraspora pellucida]